MTSTSTTTDRSTNSDAIKNALHAAYDEAGLDPDTPLGELPSEAFVDALDDVLLHRDQAVAAANGDPSPVTEEDRLEVYGTGTQAATEPDRPFEGSRETLEASLGIDDTGGEELDEYGTGQSGDTTREDRERREEQAEVLADALERLEERREEATGDD